MAVVFVEGFDYYNGVLAPTTTTVGAATRWTYGNATMGLTTGRFGGQAYLMTSAAYLITATLPATYTSGCVGFAFTTTGGGNTLDYCIFGVSSTLLRSGFLGRLCQFEININSAAQVEARRGSTILATSTTTVVYNVWNYLEVEFVISDTVGEVRVYLNNNPTPIINVSGVNTKNQTGTGFSSIAFSTQNGPSTTFDDIYVTDTPVRLGEQRVVTTYPNANVLTDFWSSSTTGASQYTMVNETTCDADTTYVSSNTTNSRVVFSLPSLSVPPINVNAVQIVGFARKDETQFRQIALEYQNAAGAVNTGSAYTLNTSYVYTNNLYNQNPLTGTTWTATDINTMRIGARVVS